MSTLKNILEISVKPDILSFITRERGILMDELKRQIGSLMALYMLQTKAIEDDPDWGDEEFVIMENNLVENIIEIVCAHIGAEVPKQ